MYRRMFSKKYLHYIIISSSCFVVGMLFFLIQRNWLVIRLNMFSSTHERVFAQASKNAILRKKVKFYYWINEQVCFEEKSVVWLSDKANLAKHIANIWLALLYDEHVVDKRVKIESVALADFGQAAYFSFDQLPINHEWSIHRKWRLFEGLCKTMHGADLGISHLSFLVHHQPLHDDHLDFAQLWPVEGFVPENENLS